MRCKEHITTSNFIINNFGTQKAKEQTNETKTPLPNPSRIFGFGDYKPTIYEDENSMMKSCGFCQNSIGNPMWQNSSFLPNVSNMVGGFGLNRNNNNNIP